MLTLLKLRKIEALQKTKRNPSDTESCPRIEPGTLGIPSQFLISGTSYLVVTVCITRFNVQKIHSNQ